MLICYSLVRHFKLQLLFLFVRALLIKCDETNYCPFIETLSFGSDIEIQCNETYFIFNEINDEKMIWKFANQSSFCQQSGKQQAFLNQCNITGIDSKYLKVPFKSLDHSEHACVYCPINYKPIAPMIIVNRSDYAQHTLYIFNLTATGLAHNESFEILWTKRANHHLKYSYNYWFSQDCINPMIEILEHTNHTIRFAVDDVYIDRVEFIIRRCSSTCRTYRICDEKTFFKEISLNDFQTPDSIEKVSCNYDCLNGIVSTTTTTTTMNNLIKEDLLSSTIQLSNRKQTIKFLILFPILGILIVLVFIILGCFIITRIKGLRADNVYTKTSNTNLDAVQGRREIVIL